MLNNLMEHKYNFEKKDLYTFLFYVRGLSNEEMNKLSKKIKEGEFNNEVASTYEKIVSSRSDISITSLLDSNSKHTQNFDYLKKRLEIQVK